MNEDIINLSAKEIQELDKKQEQVMKDLDLSPQQQKDWSRVFSGTPNELPVGVPFKFVDYYTRVVEENTDMNHIVMVTDQGTECSLSSLTRLCLTGDRAEAPLFKPSRKGSSLEAYAVLQGVQSISPELSSWFMKNNVAREKQAYALVSSGKSFEAVATEVLTYFPNEDDNNTIDNNPEAIRDINAQPASVRQGLCEPRESYIVTFAK